MKSSYKGIALNKLVDYKTANIAPFALGLFYLIFPWLSSGTLDQTTAIFGMVFLTIAIMRAKPSNTVLGGFFLGLIGVSYLFSVAGILALEFLWMFSLILFGLFFVFELGFFKVGPSTTRSDAFQMVPLVIIGFALITSFAGYGSIYAVDYTNIFEAFNYASIMAFCLVSAFQIGGWNVTGKDKSTNQLILILALAAIGTAFMGVYQGTLFQWS